MRYFCLRVYARAGLQVLSLQSVREGPVPVEILLLQSVREGPVPVEVLLLLCQNKEKHKRHN